MLSILILAICNFGDPCISLHFLPCCYLSLPCRLKTCLCMHLCYVYFELGRGASCYHSTPSCYISHAVSSARSPAVVPSAHRHWNCCPVCMDSARVSIGSARPPGIGPACPPCIVCILGYIFSLVHWLYVWLHFGFVCSGLMFDCIVG